MSLVLGRQPTQIQDLAFGIRDCDECVARRFNEAVGLRHLAWACMLTAWGCID